MWPLRPFHRTPSRGGPWPQGRTDILLAALNGRLGAVRHILRTPGAVASKPEEICRVLAAKAEVDASVSGLSALKRWRRCFGQISGC